MQSLASRTTTWSLKPILSPPGEIEKLLGRSRPFSNAKIEELVEKEVLVRTTEKKQDSNTAFKLHPRFLTEEALKSGLIQSKLL